jgi:hypothetical protein
MGAIGYDAVGAADVQGANIHIHATFWQRMHE